MWCLGQAVIVDWMGKYMKMTLGIGISQIPISRHGKVAPMHRTRQAEVDQTRGPSPAARLH